MLFFAEPTSQSYLPKGPAKMSTPLIDYDVFSGAWSWLDSRRRERFRLFFWELRLERFGNETLITVSFCMHARRYIHETAEVEEYCTVKSVAELTIATLEYCTLYALPRWF